MIVFISYSSADSKTAIRLAGDLQACGVDVWIDKQRIKVGDSIPKNISEGLRRSDFVVLLLSEKSLKSRWVEREWLPAVQREIEHGETVLFPLYLENCQLPSILLDKRYADFRDGYIAGLADLMSAFYDRLLLEHGKRCDIDLTSNNDLLITLEGIDKHCAEAHKGRVRLLLNTLLAANDPRNQNFPKWLAGRWISRLGWNKGSILEFVEEPCRAFSDIAYGSALGYFSDADARDGLITGALEACDGVASFRWIQAVGGGMSDVVLDKGWGFLWRKQEGVIKGLWWYENIPTNIDEADPKGHVHRGGLEQVEEVEVKPKTFNQGHAGAVYRRP